LFNNISTTNNTTITAVSWDFGNNLTSIAIPSAQTTYTSAGIYLVTFTVTGTNSGNVSCTDTVSKRITINTLPTADFESSNSCVGLITNFNNLSLPANGNFTWFFGPSATPSISSAQTPTDVVFNTNGPINVDLTILAPATQCTANISKVVNVNPKPDAQFGMTNNPTVAQEPVYYSDFSTPAGSITTWLWNFGDEGTGSGPSPSHSYQNGGIYFVTLTVIDSLGCSDTVSKQIEVNLIPQVPSGFTPNGDNVNDKLFVKGGPFNKMIFRVYNNWGEKLFETQDQLEGWDGKKDGQDQPVGVYVWTLEVDLYNNRTVKKNGDVTLLR
jgi:gliding motility-associated-like protein